MKVLLLSKSLLAEKPAADNQHKSKPVLFLKARDKHDSHTSDLFGTHVETHVRKDGVVQKYHVAAEKPKALQAREDDSLTPIHAHELKLENTLRRYKGEPELTPKEFMAQRNQIKNRDKASKLRGDARRLADSAHKDLGGMEPGQPVMSSGDRNKRDRAGEKMRKVGEIFEQADHYEKLAKKTSHASQTEDNHPAPVSRSMLGLIPEDRRAEWLDRYRQQHELHHYELGQVRQKMDRARSKRNKAESEHREAEAALKMLRGAPVPDPAREHDAEKHVDAKRDAYDKTRKELDALTGQHQSLYEKIAKLGREQEKIYAGSGDMDLDMALMRKRNPEDQRKHEASMLKLYREHYKDKDAKPKRASEEDIRHLFVKKPKVTPQVASAGQLDAMIKIAADSIEQLRKPDVERVLREAPAHFRVALANHIKEKRKDLAEEVKDVMDEGF